MKPMTIIFIGAIIAVIGGLISAFGTWMHNKSSSEKSTRIEEGVSKGLELGKTTNSEVLLLKEQNNKLTTEAISLKEKLENQANKIDELRKENTELYSKLVNESKTITNNLTGGDSYCRMDIGNIDDLGNQGQLFFSVEGKYPLSEIQANVIDLNFFDPPSTPEGKVINIGKLSPNLAFPSHRLILDKKKGVNINVFFNASGKSFTQLIRMRFINKMWVSAMRISTVQGITLFEKIDPNYPDKDKKLVFK